MILQEVEFDIDSAHDDEFNEWYHPHVPHILSAPGYETGRRYVKVTGDGPKYVALYELSGPDVLSEVLGEDVGKRHPSTKLDNSGYESLQPHFEHLAINVYETNRGSAPFLHGNYPIALFRSHDGDWTSWSDAVDRLVRNPDVISARAFSASENPAITWLDVQPANLLIAELSGLSATNSMTALKDAVDQSLTYELASYRQVAWHTPIVKK